MAEKNIIEKQALAIWQRLCWQHRAGFVIKTGLVLAILLLLAGSLHRVFSLPYFISLPILLIILGMVLRYYQFFARLTTGDLITYLNHRYAWLEFSTALIPRLPQHTLQQLQRQRILHQLVEKRGEVKAWPDLRVLFLAFMGTALLYSGIQFLTFPHTPALQPGSVANAALPIVPENVSAVLPQITSMQIEVKPPAYTRQSPFFAKDLSLEAPEGSAISWKCQLSAPADQMQMIWNGKDTVVVKPFTSEQYTWRINLLSSLFYQIRYSRHNLWYTSQVYTLIAKDDLPPVISVESPQPYTLVLYGQQPQVQVSVKMTDDYGLLGAHMVATVSRGSGESVKFREEKLSLGGIIGGRKEAALSRLILFSDLKMEPGDELYFYTQAWDGAIPPQKTRSDTYFVQWEDTTSQKLSVMAGLSLDNMPAYFRSQRQIIIDTEKLIKEQHTLSKEVFGTRSNNLGVDQKILRLRYGQFLGEEFEANSGGEHSHKQEGEQHQDHEEEHNSEDPELKGLHQHEEPASPTTFGDAGDMLKGYSHRHDAEEAATLFDDALKAQLKAALAQMWEAELRLRTLRPKEALPFEYKALELIKSIQQKSRVYVERVGFEPPPLKPAEKRLTGELADITNPQRRLEAQPEKDPYPAIRKAIPVLEALKQQPDRPLAPQSIRLLELAGAEVGNLILEQPGISVTLLNSLHGITAGQIPNAATIARLQENLMRVLPKENTKPGTGQTHAEPEMDILVKELHK